MAGMVLKSMFMMVVAVVFAAWAVPEAGAIGCGSVVSDLTPCIPYLTDKGPLGECCSGVKAVYEAAQTPGDRKSVCSCLKSVSGSYSGLNLDKVSGLPGVCGVSIPYKISPKIDCSTIH